MRIAAAAEVDFQGIVRWTLEHFGEAQARLYAETLSAALEALNGGPTVVGVKARNEMRQGDVGLNESYNLVLISDVANARLKEQGKTTDQITSMLLAEVSALAAELHRVAHPGPGPDRCRRLPA